MTKFPADVVAAARASQVKWKVPASVQLAQWALESSYGHAEPAGSNNDFGIKAVPGQAYVVAMTHETLHGKYVALPQHFAKYASHAEGFDAHAKLLATSHHYTKAMQHTNDPNAFANALTGIYATGIPGHPYGQALISVMRGSNLYQYDRIAA